MNDNMEQNDYNPVVYEAAEVEALEAHIQKYYGHFEGVFHELVSPDIHVDIAIIKPTEERPYWVLVTMGMGAKPMQTPPELDEYQLQRAELMLTLPPEWEMENNDEKWYWPLRWLKILARLPGEYDTWIGWGHTIPAGAPLAENTELSGVVLVSPGAFETDAYVCELPGGDIINFYQVLPLYSEEMDYKLAHGAEGLLELMDDDMLEYIQINRRNVCR